MAEIASSTSANRLLPKHFRLQILRTSRHRLSLYYLYGVPGLSQGPPPSGTYHPQRVGCYA